MRLRQIEPLQPIAPEPRSHASSLGSPGSPCDRSLLGNPATHGSLTPFITLHPCSDVSRAVTKLDTLLQAGAKKSDGFSIRELKFFEFQGYCATGARRSNEMRQLLQAYRLKPATECKGYVSIGSAGYFQHGSTMHMQIPGHRGVGNSGPRPRKYSGEISPLTRYRH